MKKRGWSSGGSLSQDGPPDQDKHALHPRPNPRNPPAPITTPSPAQPRKDDEWRRALASKRPRSPPQPTVLYPEFFLKNTLNDTQTLLLGDPYSIDIMCPPRPVTIIKKSLKKALIQHCKHSQIKKTIKCYCHSPKEYVGGCLIKYAPLLC